MTKVKEFALKVKAEIDAALQGRQFMDGASMLANYQMEGWSVALLMDLLTKLSGDVSAVQSDADKAKYQKAAESELSQESLKYLIDYLVNQFHFIAGTDCIYNTAIQSGQTIACEILARNLHESLKLPGYVHHYDYLFAGQLCSRFVSSKGSLADLALHEFIWSAEGVPVEIVACLDAYRGSPTDVVLRHVCLKQEEWKDTKPPRLTDADIDRVTLYCKEANDYFMSISHGEPEEAQNESRARLVAAMSAPGFMPFASMDAVAKKKSTAESNERLIRNGVLNDFKATDSVRNAINMLAGINKEDRPAFLSCLDDSAIFSMMLPKTSAEPGKPAKPDVRMFERGAESKLEAYLESEELFVQRESDYNKASLYLLAELFIRMRKREGDYTGSLSANTGIGANREAKVAALEHFQAFLQSDYLLNQLDKFLKFNGTENSHGPYLREGRTGLLTAKAQSLWDNLVKASERQSGLQDPNSLLFNNHALRHHSEHMMSMRVDQWDSYTRELFTPERFNSFQSFVSAFDSPSGFLDRIHKVKDGLINCVADKTHYQEDNDRYNRAVLFIFASFYEMARTQGKDNTSSFGRFTSAPDKSIKLEAVAHFKKFLKSDYPLNDLRRFLHEQSLSPDQVAKLEYALLDDRAPYSELKAIAKQAESVISPTFFADDPVAQQPQSAFWGMIGLGGK